MNSHKKTNIDKIDVELTETELESIIYENFDKIRPKITSGNYKLQDIIFKDLNKEASSWNESVCKGAILHYAAKSKYPIIIKQLGTTKKDKNESKFESINYKYGENTPLKEDILLPYLGHIPEQNLSLTKYIGDESFSNFGKNTLETRLKEFKENIKSAKEQENKEFEEEHRRERHELLSKTVDAVAKFHYYMTRAAMRRIIEKDNKAYYIGEIGKKPDWKIKKQTEKVLKDKFFDNIEQIIDYLNHDNEMFKNSKERKSYMGKIEKIVSKKGSSMFSWANLTPQIVIHGDLHGRNILFNQENEAKLIDLKSLAYGSWITDFGFLTSYYYDGNDDERRNLFQQYSRKLKYLRDSDPRREDFSLNAFTDENIDRISDMSILDEERLRQIYWNIRIAAKISNYSKNASRKKPLFKEHTKYALDNLRHIGDLLHTNPQFQYLKDLSELLDEKIIGYT